MHRKRVTSELHDSYFRLMTIKHSISKIEWASNELYNSVEFPVPVELKIGRSWRRDVVRKATPGRRGPWEALMNWGPEKMLIRCNKGKPTPQQSGPQGSGWSIRRTRKTQRDGHKFGVKIFQLRSVSSSLSHANLEQSFWTLAIKWEANIFIKKSSCLYHCVCLLLWVYNKNSSISNNSV